ncbi:hypothetical protein C8R47DRAFT_977892 [Mycena vitilis]|nr:hypothetical protein C8R47DRAFT_977892 [Mycena vitilis]
MGVAGDLIDLIMLLYDKLEYMVRVNKEVSESFFSFLGVLTGDSGSPQFWNLLLAGFKLYPLVGDIPINGRLIPKLEHADDLMIMSNTGQGFQAKLNGTSAHMGNIGCEIQTLKCLWGAMGIKPKIPQEFFLDGKPLQEASKFQYVGIWHDLNAKDMYAEHHRIYIEKAERMSRACLAVARMVGGLSVWDMIVLYMARVDPYLIAAADICPDIIKARRLEREAVQNHYLHQMLKLTERSVIAVLFSETGLEPISYRRVSLLLRNLKYLAGLTEERLVKNGLIDSLNLAREHKMAWVNDVVIVLSELPIPVYWDVQAHSAIHVKTIDGLLGDVKHSMEKSIHAELSAYSRTRDLLPDRVVWLGGKWVHEVLAFRLYLRVRNEKHRIALTHAVLSGHALAMERMRWAERYKPQVPRKYRLCRFCKDRLEDSIHALFVCTHPPLQQIRYVFFQKVFETYPDLRGAHSDPGLFFKDILVKDKTIGLLGKLAYEILEIFYSEPMAVINPALYAPPVVINQPPQP